MDRAVLTKIHLLLAAFMFPVALMFLVTGGLYTWGFKGSYNSQTYDVALQQALQDDVAWLEDIARDELAKAGIGVPSGKAKLKRMGDSFQLEWTGANRDVLLVPQGDQMSAQLIVKDTTWYRRLVQLHKAKGGVLFKVYAALLAGSLFLILFSGFVLAWQVPPLKRLAGWFAAAGLGVFLLVAGLS